MKIDISDLVRGLNSLESKTDMAIRVFAEQGAQKLENNAKTNARWTDRTGNARGRLNGRVERRSTYYRLILSHGVDYGIWLELAHERRFAIIDETIRYVGTFEIMPAFDRFIERIGR